MQDILKGLYRGFIELHILHHCNKEEIYGADFKDELKRHGYDISYGTLYPLFHRLQNEGYIEMEKRNIQGKIRKYYHITLKGKEILDLAKIKAVELVKELQE